MEFKDKVVVVTGGSKGIGRGIARAFAERGAKVVVSARNLEALAQVVSQIEAQGGQGMAVVCDVAEQSQVDGLAAKVHDEFGPVDILVNNAGVEGSHKFLGHPDELWDKIIAINLTGVYRVTKAFAPAMVERGGGRIINMASVASKVAPPYMVAYTASKHGLLGLTRSLAVEFNAYGITVNAVCPGYVDTPMVERAVTKMSKLTGRSEEASRKYIEMQSPQKRLIEVEEVVSLTLMLAGENAKGITGQAISVDGGAVML